MVAAREVENEGVEVDQLRRDYAELTHELEMANLRTVAGIAVAQLIGDVLEDDGELGVVASDIAECWQALAPSVRKEYDDQPGSTGLAGFAGDYSVAIDGAWLCESPDRADPVDEWTAERLCRLSWQIRLAQIEQRQTLHQPPNPDWLAQFPTPADAGLAVGPH